MDGFQRACFGEWQQQVGSNDHPIAQNMIITNILFKSLAFLICSGLYQRSISLFLTVRILQYFFSISCTFSSHCNRNWLGITNPHEDVSKVTGSSCTVPSLPDTTLTPAHHAWAESHPHSHTPPGAATSIWEGQEPGQVGPGHCSPCWAGGKWALSSSKVWW